MNHQVSFMSSPRNQLLNKYRNNRYNLLLVIIFSVINVIACVAGSGSYFLFSAIIPYFVSLLGVTAAAEIGVASIAYIGCAIAIALILPYLLCWIFSKKHYGWLIGALVYFVFDTVFLFVLFLDISMIVDFVFHIWILVALIMGVVNGKKLKDMPEEEILPCAVGEEDNFEDTAPLRAALAEEKIKIHIEAEVNGLHIVYRKYGKGLEELVVGNQVYAEYRFKGIAKPNFMSAIVGGHKIDVGYHQMNYIVVDNVIVKQNTRWI